MGVSVGVTITGTAELRSRVEHAHAGVLDLSQDLAAALSDDAPPMVVAESVTMRARSWGTGDVWTLPAGGWIAPRVQLPDDLDKLTAHVQQLLDGA